jgi:hypothetical protein
MGRSSGYVIGESSRQCWLLPDIGLVGSRKRAVRLFRNAALEFRLLLECEEVGHVAENSEGFGGSLLATMSDLFILLR